MSPNVGNFLKKLVEKSAKNHDLSVLHNFYHYENDVHIFNVAKNKSKNTIYRLLFSECELHLSKECDWENIVNRRVATAAAALDIAKNK